MSLEPKGSPERIRIEIQQLEVIGAYASVLQNDIESMKLSVEAQGYLDGDQRIRLRGVMAEMNLMFRNLYEPLIINEMNQGDH